MARYTLGRFSDCMVYADGWWAPTRGQVVWIGRAIGYFGEHVNDEYVVSAVEPTGPDAVRVRWTGGSHQEAALRAVRAYDKAERAEMAR